MGDICGHMKLWAPNFIPGYVSPMFWVVFLLLVLDNSGIKVRCGPLWTNRNKVNQQPALKNVCIGQVNFYQAARGLTVV